MFALNGSSDATADDLVAGFYELGVTEKQYFDVTEFLIDVLRRMNVEADLLNAVAVMLANVHEQAVTPMA